MEKFSINPNKTGKIQIITVRDHQVLSLSKVDSEEWAIQIEPALRFGVRQLVIRTHELKFLVPVRKRFKIITVLKKVIFSIYLENTKDNFGVMEILEEFAELAEKYLAEKMEQEQNLNIYYG